MSLLHGKKGVVMGVANDHSIAWGISKKLSDEIEKLIEERNNARNNNDYEKADKIRDKLSEMNVKINDVNGKTEWEIL